MDKKIVRKHIITALIFLAFTVCALIFGAENFSVSARAADGEPEVVSATAVVNYELKNNGSVERTREEYNLTDLIYAKDIEIVFSLGGAPKYRIDEVVDGMLIEGRITVADGDTLDYRVAGDGEIKIILKTFSEGNAFIGETEVKVLSDNSAPELPVVNEMEYWVADGNGYDIVIDLKGFSDSFSGKGNLYYRYGDGDIFKSENEDVLTLTVNSAGKLVLYGFDNAYNSIIREYEFDKFDGTAPAAPSIRVTPNVPISSSNGYASSYDVEIEYFRDTQSGLKSEQLYVLNGETKVYSGPFTLSEVRNYEIRAYAVDNVGNASPSASRLIDATSFDRTEPTVTSLRTQIDLRKEKSLNISFVAYDTLSGIKYAYLEGTDITFAAGAADVFSVDVDYFDRSGALIAIVEDRTGNRSVNHVAINSYDDELLTRFNYFHTAYLGLDFTIYEEASRALIEDAYEELNSLIMSELSQRSDFERAFRNLDELLSGENRFIYTIESTPSYFSGLLTYNVDTTDFENYKVGDEIKIVGSGEAFEGDFLLISGFNKGFTDYLTLKIYHNGTEVGNLNNGIKIALNMPVGYYGRNYAVIDADTGEKIEISCISNQIRFTLKKSTRLALVISGDRQTTVPDDRPKTISVFGRKMGYGAFFGSIFGVVGGVAVIVAVLVVVMKKRGKR